MALSIHATVAAIVLQLITGTEAARAEGQRPYSFSAMLGAAYAPTYEGSDNSEATGLPDFNVSFDEGRFFAGTRGIGFAPILSDQFSLKAAVGYGGGRDVADDPANLTGMGDIDAEALALASGEYRIGQFSFGADLAAGKDYGFTADLKVSTGFEISDRITLGGEIGATYADTSHMQRYFGVTAAQVAPGRGIYNAGSGIKSAGIGLSVSYAMTNAVSVEFGARYNRLMGEAAESTLTRDASQASAFLDMSTQF